MGASCGCRCSAVAIYGSVFLCFDRSAKLIPEDDQIFTDVELNLLEKVINETTVGNVSILI